jgi:hypothetical protein
VLAENLERALEELSGGVLKRPQSCRGAEPFAGSFRGV